MPIVSFVGYSNSGKTTLICRLINELKVQGFRVATIKHTSHEHMQIGESKKDSVLHWNAGAKIACFSTPHFFSLVKRVEREVSPEYIALKYSNDIDLVIVEGNKKGNWPKIGVAHCFNNPKYPFLENNFIALIDEESDEESMKQNPLIPCFKPGEIGKIASFIIDYFHLN